MSNASYRGALKATSITGASQVVVLLLRLMKVKVIALILGPAGVGLFGILSSIVSLASTAAGMGTGGSAIRQVAEAAAAGDPDRIARVIWTLRRTVFVLGCLGAMALALLSAPISVLSLGTTDYAMTIAVLAAAVLLGAVNGGQTALLRGLRKIPELAKLNIWGAFWGAALAVPFVWFWGLDGIAPAIVVTASFGVLASWWYARKVQVAKVEMPWSAVGGELKILLGFGFVFLVNGLINTSMQYGLRAILANEADLVVVGEFQAAAALSMVYVMFILQAMAQDFYPQLTGIAKDNAAVTKLVNEQAELSLLLAGPGVIATVVLAPWLIELLYSDQFVAAINVLRWQCLGVLLQVASWPIGYILLARGEGRLYLATVIISNAFHVVVFWLLVKAAGLTGAGFGLAVANLLYLPLIYLAARGVSGFFWTRQTWRVLLIMSACYAVAMLFIFLLPDPLALVAAGSLAVAVAIYAYRQIARLTAIPLARRAIEQLNSLLPWRARASKH